MLKMFLLEIVPRSNSDRRSVISMITQMLCLMKHIARRWTVQFDQETISFC